MDDTELAVIRAKRMAELQRGAGGGGGGAGGPPSMGGMTGMPGGPGAGGQGDPEEMAAKQAQMEEMRRTMLAQVLDASARERLNRISIVKADKARQVEELIIRMARAGQLQGKIGESQLIDLLEQIRETQEPEATKRVVINRRRFDDSEDDEEYVFK